MKIGVLTGGGDAPGLNAVIRAIVKSSKVKHNCEVIGIEEGFDGLLSPVKIRPMTPWNIRGILPTGGTILGTTSTINPMQMTRTVEGKQEQVDLSGELKRTSRNSDSPPSSSSGAMAL